MVFPLVSALESVAALQNIETAAVISLLFRCQRANACRDMITAVGKRSQGNFCVLSGVRTARGAGVFAGTTFVHWSFFLTSPDAVATYLWPVARERCTASPSP